MDVDLSNGGKVEEMVRRNGAVHDDDDHHYQQQRKILVTGGAGYIGSHTTLQLLLEGYAVVILDNLDNSCEEAVYRVQELAGEFGKNLTFVKVT